MTHASPRVALPYDDLPEGSNLQREQNGDRVTINVPAGEVSAAGRKRVSQAAMIRSALSAAGFSLTLGIILLAGFHDNIRRLDSATLLLVKLLSAVCVAGIFALLWLTERSSRIDALARRRQQATVLHVTPERLLVETAGPMGSKSYDLPAGDIKSLSIGAAGQGERQLRIECYDAGRADTFHVVLLEGREAAEARWVVQTLRQVLKLPADAVGSPALQARSST